MSLPSSSSDPSMEGLVLQTPLTSSPTPYQDEPKAAADGSNVVMKGRRTKRRLRPHPSSLTGPASSTTTSSAELSESVTEEEEDMAKCLILLARGRASETAEQKQKLKAGERGVGGEKFSSGSRRFAEATTTTNGKAGFYVYECRTCNKRFPSFQALGGHRASHKKPKTAATMPAMDDKREMEGNSVQISMATLGQPLATPPINGTNKSKVHECAICGSEFSSGQALGGHMRRHRPITAATQGSSEEVIKKEKNLLPLDLNLPAPTDDDRCDFPKSPPPVTGAFPFSNKQQPILFTESALVDCHY